MGIGQRKEKEENEIIIFELKREIEWVGITVMSSGLKHSIFDIQE